LVSIGKLIIYGLVGAFALSALIDPARASGTVSAFSGIGTALGSLGAGALSLGTGVGTGIAKLFNPLFTLRDLIYSPQAGVQVQTDIRDGTSTGSITNNAAAQQEIQLDPNAPSSSIPSGYNYNYNWNQTQRGDQLNVPFYTDLSISPVPVANVTVQGGGGSTWNLPLSQAAIDYYQQQGVVVSPQNPASVASQNSSNATSASHASTGANTSSLGSSQSGGGFTAAN